MDEQEFNEDNELDMSDIPESLKDKFEDLNGEEYLIVPDVKFDVSQPQSTNFLHPM